MQVSAADVATIRADRDRSGLSAADKELFERMLLLLCANGRPYSQGFGVMLKPWLELPLTPAARSRLARNTIGAAPA